MVKVTFTLDDETVSRLRQAAERTSKPQSQVVREAVKDYADRVGRLSEAERLRMIAAIDTMVRRKPTRPQAEVEQELRAIRSARRSGGRRHRA
jgi:predicted transcriptional regulator